jgi:hypothetical protein
MIPTRIAAIAALTTTFVLTGLAPAVAQEPGHIALELNALDGEDTTCRLTFLVTNQHTAPISKAVYETVVFTKDGRVDRLTLFDFGTLPVSRPRVRQFELANIACANLGQILINGAHACMGDDLPDGACDSDLRLSTRTDAELTG